MKYEINKLKNTNPSNATITKVWVLFAIESDTEELILETVEKSKETAIETQRIIQECMPDKYKEFFIIESVFNNHD